MLVTVDRDFGELVFRQKRTTHGVLLVRLAGLSAAQKTHVVSQTLREHENEAAGAFMVVSPGLVRIRH